MLLVFKPFTGTSALGFGYGNIADSVFCTSLLFTRLWPGELEKPTHDVNLALCGQWGLPIFQNIARSEETYTGTIKNLLDTFNILDPASDSPPVIFTDSILQNFSGDLIMQGERLIGAALKVGGVIEEIDILIFKKHWIKQTTPTFNVYTKTCSQVQKIT